MNLMGRTAAIMVCLAGGLLAVNLHAFGAQDLGNGATLLLEPKQDGFKGEWIDPGPDLHSDTVGKSFYVRRKFSTEHPESFNRVDISADSQYILWVNGKEIFRGPARFDPQHHVYDTLDLSGVLVKGENIIAAQVMYWGLETNRIPYFQCSARPAFLFDSVELKSDGKWRMMISPGHEGAGEANTRGGGAAFWYERVDARVLPVGFERLDFDDRDWARARVLCTAEKWGDHVDTYTPWKLYPRRIPGPEIRAAETCVPLQSGIVEGKKETPPYSFKVNPDGSTPSLPFTIPSDGKNHYLVLDAGRLVNGYVSLDLEGTAGNAVEVMYAEAPMKDGDKERRDLLGDKRVEGSNDIYITRDGRQSYEPFIQRTFRFVRVAARAASKPLTIYGLSFRWTGYPFPERGKFTCSDDTINKIWQVGWYTQRMCAFDTFQDCPYYERLQYGGDTRIQGLISLYASGDPLLLANAVRQLQASALPEGLVQSRYPNHVFQVIPGYSLCWIQMLDDYYRLTGDIELVRESIHTVDSILRFYERHTTDKGFIANLPYWNFYDWTYEKSGVPDAHWENCTLSTMHYKGALDIATVLFEALNDPLTAERYRGISKQVAEKINSQAWDEQAGLYRDGIATKTFSQHVNVFAILFGLADEKRSARISEKLFTDPSLRGTTFYFAHYLHEAAERLGKPEYVMKDLDRWQGMLDLGATTWWETPKEPRSECHAWSATPTYRLMEMVLGVRPAAPGFEKVIIEPRTVGLDWAEGTVPTPHGDIHIRWENDARLKIDVTLPEGVSGEAVLPDGRHKPLSSGHTQVTE